jgi:hypothetical protein
VTAAANDFDSAKENAERFAKECGLPFLEDGAEPLQYEAYRATGEEILDQAPRSSPRSSSANARARRKSSLSFRLSANL